MKKILWFEPTDKKYNKYNLFYKNGYRDIEIPSGVFRVVSLPVFKSDKEKASFIKRIKSITDGAVLLEGGVIDGLNLPVLQSDLNKIINKNIEKLIASIPKQNYKTGKINIVIKNAEYYDYIKDLPAYCDVTIIIEQGDKEEVYESLLDEYGISMHIESNLSAQKMKDSLSVFMPETTPPKNSRKNLIINFSGRECRESITEKNIICQTPAGFDRINSITGNNIKTILAILAYTGYNADNAGMVLSGIKNSM